MIALILVIIQYFVLIAEIFVAVKYCRCSDSKLSDKLFYWMIALLLVNVCLTPIILCLNA